MRVAFWNINLGTTSFVGKKTTFADWCARMAPDLLILEEVSSTLTVKQQLLEDATGMGVINYVNTVDKNLDPSTKQLVALGKTGNPLGFAATVLRFPALASIRASIKVTGHGQPDVYGLHANASISGGAAAKAAVTALVGGSADNVLVGGDFNGSMPTDGSAVASLRWDGKPLAFTQWTAGKGSSADVPKQFGLLHGQITTAPRPSPNGVIDYVMAGRNVSVTPLVNVPDEKTWCDIVGQFDHTPVVYDVKLKA